MSDIQAEKIIVWRDQNNLKDRLSQGMVDSPMIGQTVDVSQGQRYIGGQRGHAPTDILSYHLTFLLQISLTPIIKSEADNKR